MATESSLDVQGDPGWVEMEAVSQHVQILPEKTLKQITRGPLAKFAADCQDDEKVSRVWQSLLETFSTTSISYGQMTAACNAISTFLDSGVDSASEATRKISRSSQTWMAIFEVYMNRYDDAKPRSMRQVLMTLVHMLKCGETDMQSIRSKIVDAITPCLLLRPTRSQLKASLLSFDIFVRKHAILPQELISLVEEWLIRNSNRWTHLLQEDCHALSIDASQFVDQSLENSRGNARVDQAVISILSLGLASWGKNQDFASAAGSALASLSQSIRDSNEELAEAQNLSSAWVSPVRHVMLGNMGGLEPMSNHVLYSLFKVDHHGFNGFMNTLPLKSILSGDMTDAPLPEIMLLFSALQVGKTLDIVHEDYSSGTSRAVANEANGSLVLRSDIIGQFLLHRESSIRITALSLLVTATSTTKPITSTAAWAILRGLPSMHAESDAHSRGEILSLARKFITRVKGGFAEHKSKFANEPKSENGQHPSKSGGEAEVRTFLNAYLDFLKADLRPGVSYPRHITALKALMRALQSGLDSRTVVNSMPRQKPGENNQCRISIEIFHPSLLRLLADLLLDPFDDVRATSLSILQIFPRDILMGGLQEGKDQPHCLVPRLTDALSRAEQLASNTSRADHADSVARLYHILFSTAAVTRSDKPGTQWWETKAGVVDVILKRLEEKMSMPDGLFSSSMRDAPLHGFLSALRYIIMTPAFYACISDQPCPNYGHWRSVHDRILSMCSRIWHEVKPVLCVESPEGHTDEPAEDLGVGPKDILSYSWRALRESSLLLHDILSNATYGPKAEHGLKREDYEEIGTVSFVQLAELRHRGAFSTVALTFTTCCQRCGESKDPSISALPEGWYEEVRKLIFETASKLTRRSAGLPALITGIVSSKPGGPLFQRVMNDLHEVSSLPEKHDTANQDAELPQVHAMNCLQDIFPSNRIGPLSDPFVMRGLTISAERLGSPVWAVRNSGLMLFRALMTRMFRLIPGARFGFGGDTGAEPGARISFGKFPGLVELLSDLLSPAEREHETEDRSAGIVTERVFPALELIGEKVPTSWNADDSLLRRLVMHQLKSSVWAIREHAARVYASLLNRSDILQDIQELLNFDQHDKTQNHLHGKALGIRYALRRYASAPQTNLNESMNDVLSTVHGVFASLFPSASSPFIAAVLIEIMNEVVEQSIVAEAEGKVGGFLDEAFGTYDLDDIHRYIFDSSDATSKFSSTARASSLLRRELSWCMILRLFMSSRLEGLVDFFQIISDFDTNAARWLLAQMQNTFGEREQYSPTLTSLCSSVILGRHAQEVKWAAIENLASILEHLFDAHCNDIKGIELPCEELEKQLEADGEVHMRSREMADAELRLQGCLLTVKAALMQSPASTFAKDIRKWAVKLQFAMQEETEFTTRHAAALSLAAFARILRPAGGVPRVDDVFMDIYLIICDMLVDDDEEIRDLMASTASWVLSYSSVSPGRAVSLDCLSANALLTTFISQNYSSSPRLCNKVFQYIAGRKPRVSSAASHTKPTPVSNLMTEFRKESTVLFVEEKQNLFIDEVRELDVWTKNLSQLTETAYGESLITEIFGWVSEGLSYLSGVANDSREMDGLLGWTSKPEVFTLGVRVISIAGTLISKEFPASRVLGQQIDILRDALKSLADSARRVELHPEWLSRAQTVLESHG